jgi:hypothetical protein
LNSRESAASPVHLLGGLHLLSGDFPSEEEIAAKIKCPLHGNRFRQPIFHIYVAKWRREGKPKRRQRLSPQYQKAWLASFPEDLVSQPLATTNSGFSFRTR